ncbi:hypothetical protein [Salisediminibacterium halotolerans]|uniref:ABC-2 type transport system permease protein n=1 Tax=Salisediminibacterium halotolerans TaxID=517425 RepID=A0A1H9VZZ9_9BACI|nr:hypothetical protein [Salisediminibacterium haloalkalitolerans]SES26843.1 hypothetical protein SAMN05444126_12534 [Salisediminibacterium haloalkalitolerans]
MINVFLRELNGLLWQFQSILIIGLAAGLTYLSETYSDLYPQLPFNGFALIMIVFGFLVVLTVSHDALNSEAAARTFRLVVIRIPRAAIFGGKLLAHAGYWLIMLIVAVGVTGFFTAPGLTGSTTMHVSLLFFSISTAFFLSALIKRPLTSKRVSVLAGILLPAAVIWSYVADNWLHAVSPYHMYIYDSILAVIIPLFYGAVLLSAAYVLFERSDL